MAATSDDQLSVHEFHEEVQSLLRDWRVGLISAEHVVERIDGLFHSTDWSR
jgi:hypothetical protein